MSYENEQNVHLLLRARRDSGQGLLLLVAVGVYLICMVYSLQHSKEDRQAYLNHIIGGEIPLMLLGVLFGLLALAFLSGHNVRVAAQILATILPLVILLIDGNLSYWHHTRKVEIWNQMKLIGHNVGIFGTVLILATDG